MLWHCIFHAILEKKTYCDKNIILENASLICSFEVTYVSSLYNKGYLLSRKSDSTSCKLDLIRIWKTGLEKKKKKNKLFNLDPDGGPLF